INSIPGCEHQFEGAIGPGSPSTFRSVLEGALHMPATISRPKARPAADRVTPSVVGPSARAPFTLHQELKPCGAWAGETVWVPPRDASTLLAETMLRETRPFTSQEVRWATAADKHRAQFTQVREIDLFEA